MALVGDVIFGCRAQVPDLPLTLPPVSATVTVVTATGSTLPAGTYACIVTQRNPWGETFYAGETISLVVGANQGIQIVSPLLPGATAIRAYLTLPGGAAGSEVQFIESPTSPFTISAPLTAGGVPPARATAYLPDSDGPQFGASTVYDWLNDGLKKLSRITGGLLDYAGVPTQAGNPLYVCPGEWLKITDVWYGGYWVQGGKRGDFFRRSQISSQILTGVVISIFTDRQMIEVSYQPDRNAGVTATTANMAVTDTSVAIANTGAFLLPFGFAQIGTEIVAYSSLSGGVMGGLIRGVGSSSPPQAWPNNTAVTELPLFWCGKRIFNVQYAPGNAALNLPVPNGWDSILKVYMLGRAREAEQDRASAKELYAQFEKEGEAWMYSNRGVVSFVQVGGANVPQTYANTPAGGLILP